MSVSPPHAACHTVCCRCRLHGPGHEHGHPAPEHRLHRHRAHAAVLPQPAVRGRRADQGQRQGHAQSLPEHPDHLRTKDGRHRGESNRCSARLRTHAVMSVCFSCGNTTPRVAADVF